eukprot:74738_1
MYPSAPFGASSGFSAPGFSAPGFSAPGFESTVGPSFGGGFSTPPASFGTMPSTSAPFGTVPPPAASYPTMDMGAPSGAGFGGMGGMSYATPSYGAPAPQLYEGFSAIQQGFGESVGLQPQQTAEALMATAANLQEEGSSGPHTTTAETKCPFLKEMYSRAYGTARLPAPVPSDEFQAHLMQAASAGEAENCPFLSTAFKKIGGEQNISNVTTEPKGWQKAAAFHAAKGKEEG